MDRFSSKNISTILIVVLVIINLALLGTIWYKFVRTPRLPSDLLTINKRSPGIPDPGDRSRFETGLKQFLKKELNFNVEQQEQFITLQRSHLGKVIAVHRQINDLRQELIDRLLEGKTDNESINRIAAEIGAKTEEHEKTVLYHFIRLSKICDEEQRVRYWKLMHRISDKLQPRRGPGGNQPPPKGQRPRPRGDESPGKGDGPGPKSHRPPPR